MKSILILLRWAKPYLHAKKSKWLTSATFDDLTERSGQEGNCLYNVQTFQKKEGCSAEKKSPNQEARKVFMW